MKRVLLASLLALPIAGLATNIAVHETARAGASEWRIPAKGYDPRDVLRGQYIQFSFDWKLAGDSRLCTPQSCTLCLSRGDDVIATIAEAGRECANRVDVASSGIDVIGGPVPQFGSRIFVSETSAARLDAMLRNRPVVMVAQLTKDGRLINVRLEPAT